MKKLIFFLLMALFISCISHKAVIRDNLSKAVYVSPDTCGLQFYKDSFQIYEDNVVKDSGTYNINKLDRHHYNIILSEGTMFKYVYPTLPIKITTNKKVFILVGIV